MNKRGLELSINFIIILILAVVTLFMGIVIFRIMFAGGTQVEKDVSDRTKQEINKLLMRGEENVVLPEFYRQMSIGEVHAFGLGVRNTGPTGEFTVYITPKNWALNNLNTKAGGPGADTRGWYFEKQGPYQIGNNALQVISVPIQVKSNAQKSWTYVFNVEVKDQSGSRYGDLQKIYVEVI